MTIVLNQAVAQLCIAIASDISAQYAQGADIDEVFTDTLRVFRRTFRHLMKFVDLAQCQEPSLVQIANQMARNYIAGQQYTDSQEEYRTLMTKMRSALRSLATSYNNAVNAINALP